MSEKTFTDLAYDVVERLEGQRSWMPVVLAGVALATLGLLLNAAGLILFAHQKDGLFDLKMVIVTANIVTCVLFVIIGTRHYALIRRFQGYQRDLEDLEKTVYDEVVNPE